MRADERYGGKPVESFWLVLTMKTGFLTMNFHDSECVKSGVVLSFDTKYQFILEKRRFPNAVLRKPIDR